MSDFKKDVIEMRKNLSNKFGEEFTVKTAVHVKANNLDDLYFNLVDQALKHGRINFVDEGSRAGNHRLEFDYVTINVANPTSRPLAPQPRPGVTVTTNEKKIEKYARDYLLNGSLKSDDKEAEKLTEYKYSSWIVGIPEDELIEKKGIPRGTRLNQLEWVANHFANKGYGNNHGYITIGCAESLQRYDWPYKDETDRGTSECLRGLDFKIRDNKLNLACIFRSWDLIAGLPENLGGLAILMETAADWVNMVKPDNLPEVKPERLYGSSHGLHIYEDGLDLAKLIVGLDEIKQ